MGLTYGQAEAASMIVRALATGRLLHFNDAIGVIDQGVEGRVAIASLQDGIVQEEATSLPKTPLSADPVRAAELARQWDVAPEWKATKVVRDAHRVAAETIVAAFADGRVLHVNGSVLTAVSSDGAALVTADVASGVVETTRLDRDLKAANYVAAASALPADMAEAQRMAASWGVQAPARRVAAPRAVTAPESDLGVAV